MTRHRAWLVLWLACLTGSPAALAGDPANMAGTWTLKIVVPQGTRTPGMVLTQQGETLSGTYKATRGQGAITGKVTDNSFVLTTEVSNADTSLVIEYRGTLSGDTLRGTVHMGRLGEAAFTGTRSR
jgi:hypothetical protein